MEPLVASVWSCDPAVALDYPARYLFSFLDHHGMLGVFGSPEWRTVTGGSRTYVERVGAAIDEVRTGTKVTSVLETGDGVEVTDGNGVVTSYDAVVIATHPGQALAMLAAPTAAQREVLAALPYSRNVALLHTDDVACCRGPRARGRRGTSGGRSTPRDHVTVTYDLTRLQRLPTDTHYLVTLGGEDLVDPATVIDRMEYEHPLYTPDVRRRPGPPGRDRHRPDRLRRRLPRLGLPRGRRALGPGRRRAAGARMGGAPAAHLDPIDAGDLRDHDPAHPPYAVEAVVHAPLPHLAGRPRRPARPRAAEPGPGQLRGARPPRRPGPHDPRQRRRLPAAGRASSSAPAGC